MAKTCRTCTFACWNRECGHKRAYDPIGKVCDNHKPRETPLLVDELADELSEAMEVIELYAPNHPVRDSADQVLNRYLRDPDQAEGFRTRALTRHQEEVGDA